MSLKGLRKVLRRFIQHQDSLEARRGMGQTVVTAAGKAIGRDSRDPWDLLADSWRRKRRRRIK